MLIGCFYRFKKTVNQLCTVTNVYTYRIETERNTNLLIHKYTWLSLLRTAAKASVALLFRPPPRDDAIAAGQDTTARQKEKKPIVTRIRLHELYINLNDTKPQDSFKQHRFPPRRGGGSTTHSAKNAYSTWKPVRGPMKKCLIKNSQKFTVKVFRERRHITIEIYQPLKVQRKEPHPIASLLTPCTSTKPTVVQHTHRWEN